MADTFYGEMREPFSNESALPPSRCANCNSTNLTRTYQRDLFASIAMHLRNGLQSRQLFGGEHFHRRCRDCGHNFTSPCTGENDE